MVIENLVRTVLTELKKLSSTETIIGKPISVNEVTVVPISKVSMGFGVGGSTGKIKKGENEATGGGVSIEPVALLIIREEKVELMSIKKEGFSIGQVIEFIPKVFEEVKAFKGGKKTKTKEGKKS